VLLQKNILDDLKLPLFWGFLVMSSGKGDLCLAEVAVSGWQCCQSPCVRRQEFFPRSLSLTLQKADRA
jgi:hypothetical protein